MDNRRIQPGHSGWVEGLQRCFAVLESMRLRGMPFDPQMAGVHEQLATMFLGGVPLAPPSPHEPEAASPQAPPVVSPREQADAHYEQGNWEADARSYEELLQRGGTLAQVGPRLATRLLQMDPALSPGTVERVQAMVQQLETEGWFAEAKAIRGQLKARTPKSARRWWPFGR